MQSDTIGEARGRLEIGQVDQAWDCDSWSVALASVVVGRRAAVLASSRRVGMDPPSLPIVDVKMMGC